MNRTEILKYTRDFPPADYSLKIESYTLLSNSKSEKYDTNVFKAGGHKWRLSFYPNGDKKNNGNGYISLYLIIAETDTYALGWEVNVDFKFLVYDQMRDKYLTIQDANGGVRRFHEMKKKWGVAQLLPLETFKKSSCGYLVDDSCVFGVDVFVINSNRNWESISLIKEPKNGTFTWKIEDFSNLNEPHYYSQAFNVEGVNWKLMVYPNGDSRTKNKSISIFLTLADWGSHPIKEELYAEYKLRVLDQVNGKNFEYKVNNAWFKANEPGWGFSSFMPLENLRDVSKGFIVKDTMIIEVVFVVIFVTKFSSRTKQKLKGKVAQPQRNNTRNSSKKRN